MEPSDPKWWSSLQPPGQLIQVLFTPMLSKAFHLIPLFSVCCGLGMLPLSPRREPPVQHKRMAKTSSWVHVSLLLREQNTMSVCHWISSPSTMIVSMDKFWILASEVPKYCRKRRKIPNLSKNRCSMKVLHFLLFRSRHNSCSKGKFLWLKMIMRTRVWANGPDAFLGGWCLHTLWVQQASLPVTEKRALFTHRLLCFPKEHVQRLPLSPEFDSVEGRSNRIMYRSWDVKISPAPFYTSCKPFLFSELSKP